MIALVNKIFFFLAVFFTACIARAQDPVIVDSLARALRAFEAKRGAATDTVPADSIRAQLLYDLSHAYWSGNLDSARMLAEEVLAISEKINYKTGIGNAFSSMGVVYWLQGDYASALYYNEKALEVRKQTGNKKEIAKSYHNIGLVYDDQGNYNEALKNYLLALRLNEEINSKDGIAMEYSVIGVIYYNQKNYTEALKLFAGIGAEKRIRG
jgi:tetratricopeptide (TPR) repeat protein